MFGRCEEQGEPELAPVDVLDLVDQQVRTGDVPAGEDGRLGLEQPHGAGDEIVEVETTEPLDRAFVGYERPPDGPGIGIGGDLVDGDPQVELEPRECVVEPAQDRGTGPRSDVAEHCDPVHEGLDRPAGRAEDLQPERVERPHADGSGRDAERLQRAVEPLPELIRGTLVERDGGDRRGFSPTVDEPGDPGDERRGLAGPGRGDAQDRPGRRRGRCALVRREPREPLDERGMTGHRPSLAIGPHPAIAATPTAGTIGCTALASERDPGAPDDPRQPARPTRRVPHEGRSRGGHLCRQGAEPPQPGPELLAEGHDRRGDAPDPRGHRQGRRARLHDHRLRLGGVPPRSQPHQASSAALQHPAQGRQELPVHQDHPGRRLSAGGADTPAPERREPLLRAVRVGDLGGRVHEPRPPALPVPDLHDRHQGRRPGAPAAVPAVPHQALPGPLHPGDRQGRLPGRHHPDRALPRRPPGDPGQGAPVRDDRRIRAAGLRAGRGAARQGQGDRADDAEPEDGRLRSDRTGPPRAGPPGQPGGGPALHRPGWQAPGA